MGFLAPGVLFFLISKKKDDQDDELKEEEEETAKISSLSSQQDDTQKNLASESISNEKAAAVGSAQNELAVVQEKFEQQVSQVKVKSQRRISFLREQLKESELEWINVKNQMDLKLSELELERNEAQKQVAFLQSELKKIKFFMQENKLNATWGNIGDEIYAEGAQAVIERSILDKKSKEQYLAEWLNIANAVQQFKLKIEDSLTTRGFPNKANVLSGLQLATHRKDEPLSAQLTSMRQSIEKIMNEIATVLIESVLGGERAKSAEAKKEAIATLETEMEVLKVEKEKLEQRLLDSREDCTRKDRRLDRLREVVKKLQTDIAIIHKQHELEMEWKGFSVMPKGPGIGDFSAEDEDEGSESRSTRQSFVAVFTRLDLDRNAKTLRRAVRDEKLTFDFYHATLEAMENYVNLPIMRWEKLVRKYVHHRRITTIKELTEDSRLKQLALAWLQKRSFRLEAEMSILSAERQRLATDLTQSLNEIENASGLFLIKPYFSYKSPSFSNAGAAKHVIEGTNPTISPLAVQAPPPSASHFTGRSTLTGVPRVGASPRGVNPKMPIGARDKIWLVENSVKNNVSGELYSAAAVSTLTPRILEMDINRTLVGKVNPSASREGMGEFGLRTLFALQRHPSASVPTLYIPTAPVTSPALPPIRVPADVLSRIEKKKKVRSRTAPPGARGSYRKNSVET